MLVFYGRCFFLWLRGRQHYCFVLRPFLSSELALHCPAFVLHFAVRGNSSGGQRRHPAYPARARLRRILSDINSVRRRKRIAGVHLPLSEGPSSTRSTCTTQTRVPIKQITPNRMNEAMALLGSSSFQKPHQQQTLPQEANMCYSPLSQEASKSPAQEGIAVDYCSAKYVKGGRFICFFFSRSRPLRRVARPCTCILVVTRLTFVHITMSTTMGLFDTLSPQNIVSSNIV